MNNAIKTSVTIDTKKAEKSLSRLEKRIQAIQRASGTVNTKSQLLSGYIIKSTKLTDQLGLSTNKVSKAVSNTNKQYKQQKTLLDTLISKAKRLASIYLGVMGAKAALTTSDMITSAENRLNNTNATALGVSGYNEDGSYSAKTLDATQSALDKIYVSSQKVRSGYSDMLANVSKSITLAGDAFNNNIDDATRFQEIMAEAYTLGGASAAEQSSSMYQMIQALGSGILQGDELRSVREGAPVAYKEIEKFAQGVYDTTESLKDLASEGKITSDIVVAAMMNAGDGIDKAFENTNMTFAQAFKVMQNTAIKSFEPVLQMLNKALNSSTGQAIIKGIGTAIQVVAGVVTILFNAISNVYNFIVTHWGTISKILISLGIILSVYIITQVVALGRAFILSAIQTIASVAAMIVQFIAMGNAVGYASAMSIMFGITINMWVWIAIAVIAIIIALLIIFSDSFADAIGKIVGVVFAAGAIIANFLIGLLNSLITYFWTIFVAPWISIIEFVLNVFQGGFDTFGDGVKNLLGNIISWFLSLGEVVTTIIDAIFGFDWTGKLEGLKSSVLSWGKNNDAITLDKTPPDLLQRVDITNSYDKGYGYGYAGGEWASNKLGSVKDWASNKLGLNDNINGGLDNGNYNNFDLGGIGDDIGKTAGNTGKMADSMELTQEDLEYLRKVADMEWKKEFTTASITVDMSNYNTINGDNDLDGIVTKLADKLYEELETVADGVYV